MERHGANQNQRANQALSDDHDVPWEDGCLRVKA